MKFIYLSNGAVYCWWGKAVKPSLTPISAIDSMFKGLGKLIDVKEQWFLVYDPSLHQGKEES